MGRIDGPKPKPLRAAAVEQRVRELLDRNPDPKALREALEPLAAEPAFPGLTWLWGPELYRRHRVMFRPFILSHFASIRFDPPSSWQQVTWAGKHATRLEEWLREADRANDVQMFRRLYQWKLTKAGGWGLDHAPLVAELRQRFAAASTPPERATLLQKFDLWFGLEEDDALALYRHDAKLAGPFILKHLPVRWGWLGGEKRSLWKALYEAARQSQDEKTALTLFRRQVPLDDWARDALDACGRIRDPEALCEHLEARHPEGWNLDLGHTFAELLERRGMALWPYLRQHLFQIRQGWIFRTGYDSLLAIARKNGWWPMWAGLLRLCARPQDFNREIRELVADRTLPGPVIQERLLLLTGVAREWNFPGLGFAQFKPLEDETALTLYERFPHLVRGPFRMHLVLSYGYTYPRLLDRFLQTGEDDLVDYLASRAVTRSGSWLGRETTDAAERLSVVYEGLRSTPEVFSRRAGNVLTRVPAFSIFDFNRLVRENRLARLLFERSLDSWLDDPVSVANLVEAPEIHVQHLAYRILSQPDPRAKTCARDNLPVLIGTLLRPLHRRTRTAAFRALLNAAVDEPSARLIVTRAREAFDLPDLRYPKEALLALLARLLALWPGLRAAGEIPRVFEASP